MRETSPSVVTEEIFYISSVTTEGEVYLMA
jgi:hypothetical protein